MAEKIFVGMSGGVDSSVTALLLKQSGYDVTGVYMKNWTKDLPGFDCPWQEDFNDAKRVATQLNIPFKVYDFETKYRSKVVDYMLEGYKSGLTPNPDIMCNQEIKFKLFLDLAISQGADKIATGHYAKIVSKNSKNRLQMAKDKNKDQTYFLYRINPEALDKSLMPVGDYDKPDIRKLAASSNLITANKKDSQGICFVGKVGIKDFLLAELGPQEFGQVVDDKGLVVGEHDGAIFYTIGQRHGLSIGGGLPYYVYAKDMDKNIVYVTRDLDQESLWRKTISLTSMHFLVEGIDEIKPSDNVMVRTRYRAPLVPVKSLKKTENNLYLMETSEEIRAVTIGQSAVFYRDEVVLGGGIIC